VLGGTDPEEPVWSWAGDNRAVFWLRLEALEAGVHRWDAQGALGTPESTDGALAVDGIDPTIRWFLPVRRLRSTLPARSETYRFDQTDGPGTWSIQFDDGAVLAGTGSTDAHVVSSGTASEILLYLWHRVPASALSVTGDIEVLDRFDRLLPPL